MSGEWFWLVITGVKHGQPSEKLASWQIIRGFAPGLEHVNLNIRGCSGNCSIFMKEVYRKDYIIQLSAVRGGYIFEIQKVPFISVAV